MMKNWMKNGLFTQLPTGNKTVTFASDDKYAYNTYDGWSIYRYSVPELYYDLRVYAVAYGYKPESGMKFKYVTDMVQNVATDNGYSISMTKSSSFTGAKETIQRNVAAVIGVNDSSSYDDHGMALMGYIKYTYESGWWIFSSTKTAYFYAVDDGHGTAVNFNIHTSDSTISSTTYKGSWYDPNAGASNTYIYMA